MRKFVLLVLAALAALTVTAAPAGAGVAAPAKSNLCTGWGAAGSGSFDSLGTLTAVSSTARGEDLLREPALDATYEAMPASAEGKGGSKFKATVDVAFHVVTDGGIGAVTQEQIDQQITIMNLAFAGFYGGANTGFKFRLAGVTRTDNAAWFYAGPSTREEREMKKALHLGGWDTLNYYSTTAGPYLGWAYLPGLPDAKQYLDGIVVDWESMYKTSLRYENRYDLGYTAVHEAGHWFNLEHTFWGGCTPKGDYVDDTPAMSVPTSGCPADGTNDTCPDDPGFDPIHNYMDYSYDQCYTEFTRGQGARGQDAWLYYRAS